MKPSLMQLFPLALRLLAKQEEAAEPSEVTSSHAGGGGGGYPNRAGTPQSRSEQVGRLDGD